MHPLSLPPILKIYNSPSAPIKPLLAVSILFIHRFFNSKHELMRNFQHNPFSRTMWQNPITDPQAGFLAFLLLFLLASSQTVTAQFSLVTGAGDPLNLQDVGSRSVPVFVDLDQDCDKDLVVGNSNGELVYYKNTGIPSSPTLTLQSGAFAPLTGLGNPFLGFGVGNNAKPAFIDIDGDGDLDLFVGALDGMIHAYRNDGTALSPNFNEMFGPVTAGFDGNPFDLEDVGANSSPAFLDFDNDGDYDCFVGRSQGTNSIRYFRNEGDNTNPVFTEQTGPDNELSNSIFSVGANGDISSNAVLTVVNLDGDADMDIYVGVVNGTFRYFRNNGVSFTHFASGLGPLDPGVPTPKDISTSGTDYSAPTFVDIDADGDLDCFSGRSPGTFVFYRNTAAAAAPIITCNPYRVNLSAAGSVTVNPATLTNLSSYMLTTTFPCPTSLSFTMTGATQVFGCTEADNMVSPASDGGADGTLLTLTATDGVTSTTCAVVIYVLDVTPPVANTTTLADLTRDICNYDASTGLFTTSIPLPSATDACTPGSAAAVRVKVNSGPELTAAVATDWDASSNPDFVIGTYTLTWIYQDARGNTSTQTQVLNIVSNAPPIWNNCPANMTLVINTLPLSTCGYNGTLPPGAAWSPIPNPIDCDPPLAGWTITNSHSPTGFFPVGVTSVSYSAQDASGNVGYCNFNVTVTDGVPPVVTVTANSINYSYGTGPTTGSISCGGTTLPVPATTCGAMVNWTGPAYTATDNCGGTPVITVSHPSGNVFPIGTTTVSYIATDAGGSSTTFCTFQVQVTDTQNPTITCPASLTVPTAPNSCTSALINLTLPAANDNCTTGLTVVETNNIYVTLVAQPPRSMAFPLGGTTFYFRATDASSNTATCAFTITVTDQQAPSFGTTCPANQTFVANINTNCSYTYTWTLPTATDNCVSPTVTLPPTFTPLNATVAPTVTSNNTGTFNEGTTRVIYTATDGASNTATCSFTVTVTNSTPPAITCPAIQPVVVSAGPSTTCTYTLAAIAGVSTTATAPCDPGVITYRNSSGVLQTIGISTFPLGLHTLTAIATDVSGNSSTCAVTISVVDNLGPQLTPSTCPVNVTVNSDAAAACGANVTWNSPVWVDNCSTLIYYNRTTTPVGPTPATATLLTTNGGGFFPVGTTTVNYVAKDGPAVTANLGTPCGFTVTVIDDDRPSITNCPVSPVTLSTTHPSCNAMYTLLAPTVTDNGCSTSAYIISYTISSPSTASAPYPIATIPPNVTLNQGNNTITYITSDLAGNTTSCIVVVQVKDQQGPIISCLGLSQIVVTASCTGVPTFWADITGMDCTLPTTVNAPTVVSTTGAIAPVLSGTPAARTGTFPVGVTTLQYTVLDNASPANSSTCVFTIDVRENTAPTITCLAGTQNFPTTTGCSATITSAMLTLPTVSDNCPATPTLTILSPTFPQTLTTSSGTVAVTWRATDASGNTATCVRNIAVTDQTPPTINCGVDIIVNTASCSGISSVSVALPTVTATDNCTLSLPIVSLLTAIPGTYPMGATVLTYQATDGAGLTATCTKNVFIRDNQPPVIVCPTNLTITNPGSCPASVPISPQSITDNCVAVNYVSSNPTALFICGTTTTVTFTANDLGGNTSTCAVNVTVNNPSACTPTASPLAATTGQTVNLSNISGVSFAPLNCCTSPTFVSVQLTAGPGIPPTVNVANPAAYTFTTAGTYTATYTVSCANLRGTRDAESVGNITFTRTINVTLPCNQTAPAITCTAPTTINVTLTGNNCSASAANINWGSVNVGDGCVSGTISGLTGTLGTITLSNNAPGSFASGSSTLVTFTATNNLGTAQCQKLVQVAANPNCNVAPTITINTCPADVTVTEGSATSSTPQLLAGMLTHNCPSGTLTITNNAIDQFPTGIFDQAGTYDITWTVVVSGCTATPDECFQEVTVNPVSVSGCAWTASNKEMVLANPGLSIDAAATGDRFGTSVDVEGDWAVVGAPWEDDGAANNNRGAAYILRRDASPVNSWSIVKKINLANGVTQDVFGESVAIDVNGNGVPTVVVGARGRTGNTGAAYIYSQNQGGANVWGLVASLAAGNGATGDAFGTSVDIDGDIVVVGAPGEDSEDAPLRTNNGAFYIFRQNLGNWGQVGTARRDALRSDNDNLGASVAVDLNGATAGFVLAGARQPAPHPTQQGFALLHGRTAADVFAQIGAKMVASDATVGDQFGNSVSVDGNTAVMGAFRDNPLGTESGAAYVFELTTSSHSFSQKLLASDGVAMDQFGGAVDIDGNNIAIGARNVTNSGISREGAVYLFKRTGAPVDPWDEINKNEPADGSTFDYFGTSVAISGCTMLVGAPTHTTSDLGAAYFIDCGCVNPQLRPAFVTAQNRTTPKAEIIDLTNGFTARCFPNPTSDMMNIELDMSEETEVAIAIADATGRLVKEVFNGTATPGARFTWDSAAHPAGLYFVRITAGTNRKVVPVSVIK